MLLCRDGLLDYAMAGAGPTFGGNLAKLNSFKELSLNNWVISGFHHVNIGTDGDKIKRWQGVRTGGNSCLLWRLVQELISWNFWLRRGSRDTQERF